MLHKAEFHWNNDYDTIHPSEIYKKHNDGNIQLKTCVIISECSNNDTVAVFQKHLVSFIKNKLKKFKNHISF